MTDRAAEKAFLAQVCKDCAAMIATLERMRHRALELNLPLAVPARTVFTQLMNDAARIDAERKHPSPPRPGFVEHDAMDGADGTGLRPERVDPER